MLRNLDDKELKALSDLSRSEQGMIVREAAERQLGEVEKDLRRASAEKVPRLQIEAQMLEALIKRLDAQYHNNVNAR